MLLLTAGLIVPTGADSASAVMARSAAAAPSLAKTSLEQFYNPFGDPWELKRPANPEVPVSLTPACHRNEPKRSIGPTPQEIQWLSRSNSRLVFEECGELTDVNDGQGSALLLQFTTALKAQDPSIKYIGHYTASLLPTAIAAATAPDGQPIGMTFIDQNRESWFVHQKGQPATKPYRLRHVSSFGEVLDITNADLRNYLAGQLAQSMTFHKVDGVAIDSCHDVPQYNASIPGNVPPDDVVANWANGCIAFMSALKQAAPSKLVFTLNYWSLAGQTSPNHDVYDTEWFNRRIAVADGIFWEDPIGQMLYPPDEVERSVERLAARIAYARTLDKYVGMIVNTNAGNQSSFGSTNAPQQQAYANYYFAAYLMAVDGPKTLMIYYTPTQAVDQFNSGTFFQVFDANVGLPTGARQQLSQGLYRRDFQRGRAFLNGSNSPLDVNLDDGLFVTGNGVPVRSATIPPKSGAVFVSAPTSAACSPRPRVRLQTTSLGAGGLQIQVFSGLGDIRRIDVGGTANTLVSVQGGPQRASGTSSVDMPLGTTSTVVTLERAAAGAGVFAPITVHDTCGPWKTFAGRGAAS